MYINYKILRLSYILKKKSTLQLSKKCLRYFTIAFLKASLLALNNAQNKKNTLHHLCVLAILYVFQWMCNDFTVIHATV